MFSGQFFKVEDRNNEQSAYGIVNSKNNQVIARRYSLEEANEIAQRWNAEYERDVYAGYRNEHGTWLGGSSRLF